MLQSLSDGVADKTESKCYSLSVLKSNHVKSEEAKRNCSLIFVMMMMLQGITYKFKHKSGYFLSKDFRDSLYLSVLNTHAAFSTIMVYDPFLWIETLFLKSPSTKKTNIWP